MGITRLDVIYGNLEGAQGRFPRDPTGYLSIEAGIFRKHGLEVSWQHVQGTEERYRRLESGAAHISFVVGRASLQHFLHTKTTRILGSSMNSCPYYLVADPAIEGMGDLKGKSLACRESPARGAPLTQVFEENARLRLGEDVGLELPKSDQDAFHMLISGEVEAALLPRPYGFMAEEKGFKKISDWPEVVDDPLPITIETTVALLRERDKDFRAFLAAHGEGIRHLKAHRDDTIRMLGEKFGHSPTLAAKTFDEYLICLDDLLSIDIKQLEKLAAQVAPEIAGGARQLASEWILPGALRG